MRLTLNELHTQLVLIFWNKMAGRHMFFLLREHEIHLHDVDKQFLYSRCPIFENDECNGLERRQSGGVLLRENKCLIINDQL